MWCEQDLVFKSWWKSQADSQEHEALSQASSARMSAPCEQRRWVIREVISLVITEVISSFLSQASSCWKEEHIKPCAGGSTLNRSPAELTHLYLVWKQCLEWLKTEWSGGKVTLNTMFALCPKAFEAPCSEIWKSLCHSQETEAADITCGSDAVFITNSNYQLHIPGCTFWVTISKCPHNIAVIGLPTLCVRCCTPLFPWAALLL